jgi:methylthioribulose-1-phosphate dehydratase
MTSATTDADADAAAARRGDPRRLLAATARELHRRGWMSGTAGNLSLRLADGSYWITASGKSKGRLTARDFLRIAAEGEVRERGDAASRPSAESSLHAAIYRLFPQAGACFHVHTVAANLVSRMTPGDFAGGGGGEGGRGGEGVGRGAPGDGGEGGRGAEHERRGEPGGGVPAAGCDELPLPPIEMLKGLGVWEENPRVAIAVLPNHSDVPAIAAELEARFRAAPPRLPGFLIRDHGLTAWGADPQAALNHLELFDFIFQCMAAARGARLRW